MQEAIARATAEAMQQVVQIQQDAAAEAAAEVAEQVSLVACSHHDICLRKTLTMPEYAPAQFMHPAHVEGMPPVLVSEPCWGSI